MKERLIQLMNYLGLNATAFSGEIGVQRSSISHILSGRNQPSFDFLAKTTTRFPQVNTEWLLTGRGTMVKNPENVKKGTAIQRELFSDEDKVYNTGVISGQKKSVANQSKDLPEHIQFTYVNKIERVIIFYKDGTFTDYRQRSDENIDK